MYMPNGVPSTSSIWMRTRTSCRPRARSSTTTAISGRGSVIIVDTEDRVDEENSIANDPFSRAGLFESVTVTRWRKALYNYERLV